ncbi:hypothetical protein LARI1_G008739 [Lachnellula arida]|uniref:Uncharacterized protein n=1 Tax=Lachnellula arida TaxID=1316785 RepID=A0A8T9AYG4_9HELO|nr:hypothetical protein LARI1_G008739 [Lachnellula arida]
MQSKVPLPHKRIAFYIKKNHPVKLLIDSRIIVDAIYFREANPNYARVSIDEPDKESSSLAGWTILGSDDSEKSLDVVKKTSIKPSDVKGDDLLICSPTLRGFSLARGSFSPSDTLKEKESYLCSSRSLYKASVKQFPIL